MGTRIIVVEDDEAVREIVRLFLEMIGLNPQFCGDGVEALRRIHFEPPDLVVTDLSLPGLDGLDLVRLIRLDGRFNNTPIIVMTGGGQGHVRAAIAAGADRVIQKPDLKPLLDAVRELLGLEQRKSGAH